MSILDDEDEIVDRAPDVLREHYIREETECLYAKELLTKGDVKCVIAEDDTNPLLAAINRAYNLNRDSKTYFAEKVYRKIYNAINPELKKHQERKIYSLDCSKLCKNDAYRMLRFLSRYGANDAIVIISNVTQIPDGDKIHDDPEYVRNLLVHFWKRGVTDTGEIQLDRRNMTVILTCCNEDEHILKQYCTTNSYTWIGDYNKWNDDLNSSATSIASTKYPELFNR